MKINTQTQRSWFYKFHLACSRSLCAGGAMGGEKKEEEKQLKKCQLFEMSLFLYDKKDIIIMLQSATWFDL